MEPGSSGRSGRLTAIPSPPRLVSARASAQAPRMQTCSACRWPAGHSISCTSLHIADCQQGSKELSSSQSHCVAHRSIQAIIQRNAHASDKPLMRTSTLCQSCRWHQGMHSRLVMHSRPMHSAKSCCDSGTADETLQGLSPTNLHHFTATRFYLLYRDT